MPRRDSRTLPSSRRPRTRLNHLAAATMFSSRPSMGFVPRALEDEGLALGHASAPDLNCRACESGSPRVDRGLPRSMPAQYLAGFSIDDLVHRTRSSHWISLLHHSPPCGGSAEATVLLVVAIASRNSVSLFATASGLKEQRAWLAASAIVGCPKIGSWAAGRGPALSPAEPQPHLGSATNLDSRALSHISAQRCPTHSTRRRRGCSKEGSSTSRLGFKRFTTVAL